MDYLHLKKAKNTIKTKQSSVFFNLFISAIVWLLTLLLFWSRYGLPGYWWCSVNGLRNCCWLITMVPVEQADEFPKVLIAE